MHSRGRLQVRSRDFRSRIVGSCASSLTTKVFQTQSASGARLFKIKIEQVSRYANCLDIDLETVVTSSRDIDGRLEQEHHLPDLYQVYLFHQKGSGRPMTQSYQ